MNYLSLTNNNCANVRLQNNGSNILYSEGITRLTAKFNCCTTNEYNIFDPALINYTITCQGANTGIFDLLFNSISGIAITGMSYVNDVGSAHTTVSTLTDTSIRITINQINYNSQFLFTLTDADGHKYIVRFSFNTDSTKSCSSITSDLELSQDPICGVSQNTTYFDFTAQVFFNLPCDDESNLRTGVYSICRENINNSGIIVDQECACVFADCDMLVCKILSQLPKETENIKTALRYYYALIQMSTYINDVTNSLNCKSNLRCSDLCDLYKLILTNLQEDINWDFINTKNVVDCGCN